ncbi:MAG: flagellar hook-basal body complex protein, partial [Pseudomonadota bacterium]
SGGASYSTATGKVTLTLASGPVDIDIGEPGNLSGLTQLSTDFSPGTINKNGSPLGEFSSIEIDSLGSLEAVYDTGFRRVLYQIPVAMVPNLNGLTPVGGQSYTVSQESGDFFLWDAGDGPTGNTVGFSQMESTADIGTEMTELIKTQRAYASNAKLIQVIDEVLQETTNIIR